MIELKEHEHAEIAGYIKATYGVALDSKGSLIEGRLGLYIASRGFKTFSDYFKFALNDPTGEEITNMINRLTTNHTYFMRENDHFEFITAQVLPWVESLPDGRDLRIWSAGCATGEEPYGLSIYILEYFAGLSHRLASCDTTILASDISEEVLQAAQAGVYPDESLSAIPPEWVSKYFVDLGNGFRRVKPVLRENVAFKKINLLDPIITKKPYHIILSRNVMIYFEPDTRASLVKRYYDAILPGGYLFIGHSESLTNFTHGFRYIKPSVYRKPLD